MSENIYIPAKIEDVQKSIKKCTEQYGEALQNLANSEWDEIAKTFGRAIKKKRMSQKDIEDMVKINKEEPDERD